MKKLELQVSFVTPAFLGNAEQQGQWRTPPFKALLRQWWRVAVAKDCEYDVQVLRQREAELFGSAAEDKKGGRSKLRLRLRAWQGGTCSSWPKKGFQRIDNQVRSDVYLGFGPVAPPSRKQGISEVHLAHTPAINVGEENTIQIWVSKKCSDQEQHEVKQAIQLAAWFGTLGSRSHNGWGSLHITGDGIATFPEDDAPLQDFALPVDQAIQSDWTDALGFDRSGLFVWTEHIHSWEQAVDRLAWLRKETRRAVKGMDGAGMKGSYLLGYPLTKSNAHAWQDNARIPGQLRFKVLPEGEGMMLCLAHFPCAVPDAIWKDHQQLARDWVNNNQLRVWQRVHQMLDKEMARIGGSR